jgi:MFS superfamily sulfate permease-like transporter
MAEWWHGMSRFFKRISLKSRYTHICSFTFKKKSHALRKVSIFFNLCRKPLFLCFDTLCNFIFHFPILPFFMSKRPLASQSLVYDLPAALVVFLVALPLCLGIALASGAPLFAGIIAGAVGGIIVGAISGSQLSVSGPAAGLTVIVLSSIQKLPSYEAFLLAVVLCGLFQIGLGLIKAGIIGDFIPSSVIRGMLSAIGLILILKQIPHAIGYDKDYEGDTAFLQDDGQNTFSEIFHAIDSQISFGALIIALVSIGLLLFWDRPFIKKNAILKYIPGPLLVVLLGVFMNSYFFTAAPSLAIQAEHLVSIPVSDSFSSFLANFKLPDFSQLLNRNVWVIAGTLAIVASLETLLCVEAVDKLDPFKRISPTNKELVAQGIGNTISGLIGGLPVTSVIVRSSANINAGARTKIAAIMHGVLLLGAVYFIPSLLNKIPLASLAAILIMTGYKLAHPSVFRKEWALGRSHFIPFVVTIVAILFTDLLVGILVGIAVGAHFVFLSNYRSSLHLTNRGNQYLLRFNQDLSFVNKAALKKALDTVPDNSEIIIDASKAKFIDLDNAEVINDFIESAQFRDIRVEVKRSPQKPLSEIKEPVLAA